MSFICTHCEKPITGVSVLIDKTHFLHPECQEEFNLSVIEEEEAEDNLVK